MRIPEYISPTSLAQFFDDRTEFYLKYIADNRPPRLPQTKPMAAGSAFDAYLKAYISEALFGVVKPEFELKTIFEMQVEKHNQDWAWGVGKYLLEQYKATGALSDLMLELSLAIHAPRLEFTVQDTVNILGTPIPLLGKPDIYFVVKGGSHIIPDFKVNGYCGSRATSPKPGYVMVRGDWGRGNGGPHKNAQLMKIDGINVNIATYLEDTDDTWARQLFIYALILGENIGSKFIAGIEQIVCKPTNDMPSIRVASHRCRISEGYQKKIAEQLLICWTAIQEKHIFTDLTKEENDARCASLDNYYKAFEGDDNDPNEKWFHTITREQRQY